MRGDKVVIDAYSLDRSPDNALVGRSMKISGNELAFRNDTGGPLWAVPQGAPPKRDNQTLDEAAFASPTWRSLLASELSDRKVVCRGQESGKVNDLIIDRSSGQIAMLSIDPNENFLGIADTKRLVPWDVATVAVDGTLRIDASKEMVLASPDTPSDLAKLNNGATARMVYKAYDVDVPAFRKAQAASRDGWNSTDDKWRSTGPILNGVASGPSQTVEGQVVEFTRVDFGDGTSPAKAVRIKTPSGEQTVLLGPAAYADTQPECCTRGKRVSIEAVKVRIDGKEQLLARRVQAEGKNTTLIDSSNKPVWDQP